MFVCVREGGGGGVKFRTFQYINTNIMLQYLLFENSKTDKNSSEIE